MISVAEISVETINGKQCTVIRKPFDAEWVKEQLSMGIPLVVQDNELERWQLFGRANAFPWLSASSLNDGRVDSLYSSCIEYVLTILPPLPRRPKPEDAPLLYRYMSEGITPVLATDGFNFNLCGVSPPGNALYLNSDKEYDGIHLGLCETFYALYNGEKVNIAIGEGDE